LFCGLTRAKKEDIDVAAEALRYASAGVFTQESVRVMCTSSIILSLRTQEVLEKGVWAVRYARAKDLKLNSMLKMQAGLISLFLPG